MAGKLEASEWIWRDGEFVKWEEATVHLLSLAVQFGVSQFEGIRCYNTPKGPCIFRLDAHIHRLINSCKIYRMVPDHSIETISVAWCAVVEKNNLKNCYIRPMVLRGYGAAGLNPSNSPIETAIPTWPWATYLGDEALEEGVDVGVSSWNRPAPNTFPSTAKSGGHYTNSILVKMEAQANGYAEGVVLGPEGRLSEGGGQNIFLVDQGTLVTPQLDGTLLPGITRDAVFTLAEELGLTVKRKPVARENLYTAQELFFCGTASEICPIKSVYRIPVGDGSVGPITRQIQKRFMDIVTGQAEDSYGWLTPTSGS